MGTRAWHNWKRRLKLQGKHGVDDGSSWGTSDGNHWDVASDTWGESKRSSWHKSESFKERRERVQRRAAKLKSVKIKPSGEKLKELKKQKWKRGSKPLSVSGSQIVALQVLQDPTKSAAKIIRKHSPKTVDPDGRSKGKTKKKSVTNIGTSNSIPNSADSSGERKLSQKRKLKKKEKKKAMTNEETSAAPLANAQPGALLKGRKLKIAKVKRKSKGVHADKDIEGKARNNTKTVKVKVKPAPKRKWKQRASVVLPGSVSDRYARGLTTSTSLHIPLTGEERSLLATGALSWRWLREADVPGPEETAAEADPVEHSQILDAHASKVSKSSCTKLHFFDECLERDALLPPCALRASLAAKLASRGVVRRRCTRQLAEVIMPLMALSPSSDGSPDGDGPVNTLREEACALCQRCAQEWISLRSASPHQGAAEAVRTAWLQMLCLSLQPEAQAQIPEGWQPLLRGFRCASLARFCLQPEKEGHPAMLRAVAAASGPEHASANPRMLVLPFGLFTGPQMLLLIAMARWSGAEAMVIRRTAAGAPDVIFRSAGVLRSD